MIKNLKLCVALLIGAISLNSCVGSFGLFNALAQWNKSATGIKFLNELIFLIISPAYAVCTVVDVLIFNTIEFWSGSNPMASNVGKTVNLKGEDGNMYAMKYLENGYEITKENGEVISFIHNAETDGWSMVQNGESKELFRFNGKNSIKAILSNGETLDLSLDSRASEYELRNAINGVNYFMAAR